MKQLKNMTEPELKSLLTELGRSIKECCRFQRVEPPLFALVLFNDPKVAQYIANCERSCMIAALRETADRLERKEAVERVEFPK